ncbi:MAG: phage tail tape measure protein [Oscillospiraceae bacterium]|nr:phage tail tape measure protein [Oscillospiraceae bacterium]
MGKINTLLSLDGESEFKRRIQDITNNLKTLDKQLGEASAKFSMSSDKQRLTSETASNLSKQLDLLRQKQDLLKAAVQRAENQVADSNKKLADARAAHEKTGREVIILKDKLEFAKKLWGENSAEANKYAQRLKEGEQRHKETAKAVAQAEKEVDKAKKQYHAMAQQLAETGTEVHKTEDRVYELTHAEEEAGEEATKFSQVMQGLEKVIGAFGKALQALPGILSAVGGAIVALATAPVKALEASFHAVTTELELGVKGLEAYGRAVVDAGKKVGEFSLNKGMSFEASMARVKAYSNASAEDLQRLSDAAKEMGATTSKTASEAADALGYLALNGYDTEQMLATLKPIVKASEAGGMDLATAANLTANALTAYGKNAEDAEEFLNILTAAQNNSATSLEQLLTAYVDLAGTFNTLHVGFEESATLMGQMANAGIKGSEAGTALNSVMLRLLETNKNSADEFAKLGISAYSEGKFKGLTNILGELNEKMAEMTEEDRIMSLKNIFGVRMFQQGLKFLQSVADSEGYSSLYDTLASAYEDNYLYKTAETMMDNLKGDVTILKSATEALGNVIFVTFSDKARQNVQAVTEWVTRLIDGVTNGNLEQVIPKLGEDISESLAAGIEMIAEELPSKLRIFNAVIVAGAKALVKAIRAGKNTILPVLITGALDLVTELLKVLPDFVVEVTDAAVILFGGLVDAMDVTSKHLVKILPDIITTVSTAIAEHGPAIFDQGFDILVRLVQGIAQNLPILLNAASKILDRLLEDLGENTSQMSQAAIDIITALVHWLGENIDKILEVGGTIIGKVVDAVTKEENLKGLGEGAYKIMDKLAEFIVEKSTPLFEIWMPKVLTNLRAVFLNEQNQKALADIGEVIAGAIMIGFEAAFRGLIRSNVKGIVEDMIPENASAADRAIIDTALDFAIPKLVFPDQKVKAANNDSAYEKEAYGNGSDSMSINNPIFNISGVQNLSDLVEEMAKLKDISDRAGGAFS